MECPTRSFAPLTASTAAWRRAPAWPPGPVTASAGGTSATFTGAGQGLLGGVFVGADYQFAPKALVGVMGDFSWSGMQTSTSIAAPGAGAYRTTGEAQAPGRRDNASAKIKVLAPRQADGPAI
ncbi:MAG: hypothetical protein PSV46_09055 [Reyranella sp.]|nr:hypothetical protein [Reyranella sp.]